MMIAGIAGKNIRLRHIEGHWACAAGIRTTACCRRSSDGALPSPGGRPSQNLQVDRKANPQELTADLCIIIYSGRASGSSPAQMVRYLSTGAGRAPLRSRGNCANLRGFIICENQQLIREGGRSPASGGNDCRKQTRWRFLGDLPKPATRNLCRTTACLYDSERQTRFLPLFPVLKKSN